MKNEKKVQYIVWGLLGLVLLGCLIFVLRPSGDGHVIARVQVDTAIIKELALDTADDGIFSIELETGLPIEFEVKEHAIRFLASDCPDKVCVNSGYLHRDMDIASCLPNRVVLSVTTK